MLLVPLCIMLHTEQNLLNLGQVNRRLLLLFLCFCCGSAWYPGTAAVYTSVYDPQKHKPHSSNSVVHSSYQ